MLLDGIGSSETVREWTRTPARRLAQAAARRGDAEAGLRAVYTAYAAERGSGYGWPKAAAVAAVTAPGHPLTVAWCGDSRAYLIQDGAAHCLTRDHNLRRVIPPCAAHSGGSRNVITSCLGACDSDVEVKSRYGHPAIEAVSRPVGSGRLVLASDGAYEPHEDAGRPFADAVAGDLRMAARRFVKDAVCRSIAATTAVDPNRPYADNATVLLAGLGAPLTR
ncbi:PP2C family protein-serine/threonine phosphatase [Streptomyces brasiliensis]|uniref:PPM-type phosphatase domain-containing protein n=1 Tax=Streptomyces brasiliensis TaxID=1954 RepID=A0A917LCM4_9ACTN|nr:mucin-2 [Streptomyces brasiliensis]GGJ59711.1 hypothetical protein GCM10010121_082960 [Streptomyces brasiliensis]